MVHSLSTHFTDQEMQHIYVLDTSVLLSDPKAIHKFEDNEIIIPLVVIRELEKKRTDPELGYFARQALREFEKLRKDHGELDSPILLPSGGHLKIAVTNHQPEDADLKDNDSKILSVAQHFSNVNPKAKVTVVSKDLPMRILASVMGLHAEEYRHEIKSDAEWSGMETIEVEYSILERLFESDSEIHRLELPEAYPVNTGIILKSGTSSALVIYVGEGYYQRVDGDTEVFGVSGRSAEQRIAIAHLLATDVGIVSIGGNAGTGKSALALLAGLEAVLEANEYKKIVVFRPLYAVGGQELGFLPGDQDEKMNPWAQAVYDTLESLVSQNVMDEVIARNLIEVLPLTHIRGRTLHDSYVIVDEAQSLERNVILTVLSRLGKGSKVVLTHDIAQRDNLHVGRFDGILSVIEALKGNQLFAHINLRKSERSAIAELVTRLLDF